VSQLKINVKIKGNNFDCEIERVFDQFLKHRMAVLLGAFVHEDVLRNGAKENSWTHEGGRNRGLEEVG
jgi:hypothetical protein